MGVVSINAITHTKSDNDEAKLRSAKTVFDFVDKTTDKNIAELTSIYSSLLNEYNLLVSGYVKLNNNYQVLLSAYNTALRRKANANT